MKSLLVHVDGTPRCAVRLKIASDLARRHESRLTALHGRCSSGPGDRCAPMQGRSPHHRKIVSTLLPRWLTYIAQ